MIVQLLGKKNRKFPAIGEKINRIKGVKRIKFGRTKKRLNYKKAKLKKGYTIKRLYYKKAT